MNLRKILALAVPVLLAAACTGTSGKQSSSAPQMQPTSTSGCGDLPYCDANMQSKAPLVPITPPVRVDNPAGDSYNGIPINPPYDDSYSDFHKDCLVNLSPAGTGISFTDTSHTELQTKISLQCAVPPHILHLAAFLQFKNSLGVWVNRGVPGIILHPTQVTITQLAPIHLAPIASCVSGPWRVNVEWGGLKNPPRYVDGVPTYDPFPDPGEPSTLDTLPQRVSC